MAAPVTYPVAIIARLLMLTERRVQQLATEGVIPKGDRSGYELAPTVQGYIRYLKDRAVGADASDAIGEARQRLLMARARTAETEAELFHRSALRRQEVEAAWLSMVDDMRTRLLAVPNAVASQVHSATTVAEVNALITAAVHDALDDLSRTPVYETAPAGEPGTGRYDAARAGLAEEPAEADDLAVG